MIFKNVLGDTPIHADESSRIIGINWNYIHDELDMKIWNQLTTNFWLPEKIPVSNDIPRWKTMTEEQQTATLRVFTGLTLLDTMQGTVGANSLIKWSMSPHEEAVYTNIAFMESVHAKSYSNIFMTLASTPEIDEAFRWSAYNENLQYKAHKILEKYKTGDRAWSQIASVMLESFLFYSGFYLPLRMASEGMITNSADIIRLIIRDEAIHGLYIGYKYQQWGVPTEDDKANIIDFLFDLYENELEYTASIYDDLGWTDDVNKFLKYNANKALNNLGIESIFPSDECNFMPTVRSALNPGSDENHDFFSGSGSSYVIGTTEKTEDEDWDF